MMKFACDIDETLSWTIGHLVKGLQERFGNPEGLSVQEIIDTYRYTHNVPYWQTKQAQSWVEQANHDNTFQEQLPLIQGARLNGLSIGAYITTRPEIVREGTQKWLKEKGFPQAPIYMRPKDVPYRQGNAWKAEQLMKLYPDIQAMIDDNAGLITELEKRNYSGILYLYSHEQAPVTSIQVITAQTWEELVLAIHK